MYEATRAAYGKQFMVKPCRSDSRTRLAKGAALGPWPAWAHADQGDEEDAAGAGAGFASRAPPAALRPRGPAWRKAQARAWARHRSPGPPAFRPHGLKASALRSFARFHSDEVQAHMFRGPISSREFIGIEHKF